MLRQLFSGHAHIKLKTTQDSFMHYNTIKHEVVVQQGLPRIKT